MSHRDRTTHKGERYVKQYRLDKWINQCLGCQTRGYNPDIVEGNVTFVASYIKKTFKPLPLTNGLCEICHERIQAGQVVSPLHGGSGLLPVEPHG